MAVEERRDDGSVLSGLSRRVWESAEAVSYEVAVETVGRLISWYSEKPVPCSRSYRTPCFQPPPWLSVASERGNSGRKGVP